MDVDDSEFKRHINRDGHDAHRVDNLFEDGYLPFNYHNETFQVYYKLAGNLKTSNRIPLVHIHGGPGYSSHLSHPHGDLAVQYDIPVILYDQTGGGKSTHLPDKPPEFWNVELFCDELEQVLQHFNIQDSYSLLGHSWGGLLAGYFVQNRNTRGLQSLVIVGAPASMELMLKAFDVLEEFLPENFKNATAKRKNGEEYDKADAEASDELFLSRYICQLDPLPVEIAETLEVVKADPTVYNILLGDDNSGLIKDISLVEDLHKITVPTLVINGEDDEVLDFTMEPFFSGIRKAKRVEFIHSSHVPFLEERVKYMRVVGEFLTNARS